MAVFDSKPLSWWISNVNDISRHIWLWISRDIEELTPETACYMVKYDPYLSAEEQDQRYVELVRSGLVCFLLKCQLKELKYNLRSQKRNYDDGDLYLALNYFWRNDKFIGLAST
ncbi:MAG: hypothetical protein KME20_28490 [Kaiparowitsia implicata GSE-PSE-MK54-09C]|jgi:hypothetical protein|nr:hypothetical protein [Kaiparowitsia implicata GSE-PSE-MK54-09C]